MNSPRHRRPKWTIDAMLLIVGWSSVVVWLNTRARFGVVSSEDNRMVSYCVFYGYPAPCAYAWNSYKVSDANPLHIDYRLLAVNVVIGVLVVAVGAWASKYLLRRIVSGLRAVVGKPPPTDDKSEP